MSRLARQYRRSGANFPGDDARPSHGAEMEGYFWRCTDAASGRALVALCGVNRSPQGSWATVALAAAPGGFVRSLVAPSAWADTDTYRVVVPGVLEADEASLRVDLGADASLDLQFGPGFDWPFRSGGGGIFSAVPFLGQYWHPHVLDARATGTARVGGGETWEVSDGRLYAEKNWGRGFPEFWWWGQAQGFDRQDVTVAFTGGVLEAGPLSVVVGGIVVRIGERVIRLTPPLARLRAEVGNGRWSVWGRRSSVEVTISARGDLGEAHVLPVPIPRERRNCPSDFEHLSGSLSLEVTEHHQVLFSGTSDLAGLEIGFRPGHPALIGGDPGGVFIRSRSMSPRRSRSVLCTSPE